MAGFIHDSRDHAMLPNFPDTKAIGGCRPMSMSTFDELPSTATWKHAASLPLTVEQVTMYSSKPEPSCFRTAVLPVVEMVNGHQALIFKRDMSVHTSVTFDSDSGQKQVYASFIVRGFYTTVENLDTPPYAESKLQRFHGLPQNTHITVG